MMTNQIIIPPTMKAVVVRELGSASSPQALSYETNVPTPKLLPHHALVKNEYSGINFIDTYYRSGLYSKPLPFIAGQEGGGTIVAIGRNDHDDSDNPVSSATNMAETQSTFFIGQTVVYSSFGSYAEYTLVPLSKLIPLPMGSTSTSQSLIITLPEAIACMVQGLTAHYLITSSHANLIQPNDWCLIYSVGSGTNQLTAQMAKLCGFKVIGTCSRGKLKQAQQLNCDELIVLDTVHGGDDDDDYTKKQYAVYDHDSIVSRVMQITNDQGVKCIFDGVGKSTANISISCLATRGIFVSFGNASGPVSEFSLLSLSSKSAYVTRPKLLDYIQTREELMGRMMQVLDWVVKKKVLVSVDCVFPLEAVKDAHGYLESGRSKGKLLLQI